MDPELLLNDTVVRDYYWPKSDCINQSYRNHMLSLMLTFLFGATWKWLTVGALLTALVQLKATAFQICNAEQKMVPLHCKELELPAVITLAAVWQSF